MIFQMAAIAALLLLAAYALMQRRRAPLIAVAILSVSTAGMLLVAMPELATRIASLVGIGRGADLVFYVFVITMLAVIFNLHLRLRHHEELLASLARAIAIQNVRYPAERTLPADITPERPPAA